MRFLKICLALLLIALLPGVLSMLQGCLPARLGAGGIATPGYWSLVNAPLPDSLVVPVAGMKRSRLRDSWGAARSGGRSHEGIDIPARRNTPVLSATRGVVTRVGLNDLGGQIVMVLGPGGHSHYYAHLDAYGRYGEGDEVEAGDTIGFVGTTGNAQGTSPHLHYGIYTSTGAINPFPLLEIGAPEPKAPVTKRSKKKR